MATVGAALVLSCLAAACGEQSAACDLTAALRPSPMVVERGQTVTFSAPRAHCGDDAAARLSVGLLDGLDRSLSGAAPHLTVASDGSLTLRIRIPDDDPVGITHVSVVPKHCGPDDSCGGMGSSVRVKADRPTGTGLRATAARYDLAAYAGHTSAAYEFLSARCTRKVDRQTWTAIVRLQAQTPKEMRPTAAVVLRTRRAAVVRHFLRGFLMHQDRWIREHKRWRLDSCTTRLAG